MLAKCYGVVGANGKTGARVKNNLIAQGIAPRGLSRHSDHYFDWQTPESWSQALSGVNSLYVTFHPDLAIPGADQMVRRLLDVARAEGVEHCILLSGRGELGAQKAEQILQSSGLDWNIVRASWFAQNFSESFMLDGVLSGKLVLPETHFPEPFVDVDDIADVVTTLLLTPSLRNRLVEVTGPEAITFAQCVEVLNQYVSTPVQYCPVPIEQYLAGAEQQGVPKDVLWLLKELFTEVLDGRNSQTMGGIQEILGRQPTSFRAYVEKTVGSGIWG